MQYHNFYRRNLLSKEQIEAVWQLYRETPVKYAQQDYSLFNVEKSSIRRTKEILANPALKCIDDYMKGRYGYTNETHYFLKYVPYSWTRVHTDNVHRVTKTVITLLEEKDLVGGETLVWDKHFDLPTPKGSYVQRTGSVHRKSEVPCTPKLKAGESLIYDNGTRHGVSQVESGHRIVLVSWYV